VAAHAAATALVSQTDLTPGQIASEAMAIAASLCVFTNNRITIETL
jgi:ATP-dependent HslUV protease subunit HslV